RTVNPYVTGSSPVGGANSKAQQQCWAFSLPVCRYPALTADNKWANRRQVVAWLTLSPPHQ
ncbi:hypothetical protein, partial [Aeromonas hydrophila]|uniref:hypothetical protein n=1 Tax=Aeromonas hydrophila TaxID=644 RepID=UPI002B4914D2